MAIVKKTNRLGQIIELDESFISPQAKPAGDISGGLNQPPKEEFSLGDGGMSQTMNDFTNFRNALQDITRKAYDKKPSVREALNNYKSQVGLEGKMIDPAVASQVISGEGQRRVGSVRDMFSQTMRVIDTMEKTRLTMQQNVNELMGNLATLGMLNEITPEEYASIQSTGVLPMATLDKINKKVEESQRTPEQESAIRLKEYESKKQIDERFKDTDASIAEQLAAEEAGFAIKDGKIVEKPFEPFDTESAMGAIKVTGFGSSLNEAGLDIVIPGGQSAPIRSPFMGEVLAVEKAGGWGNRVQIAIAEPDENGNPVATGEVVWFSHMSDGSTRVKQGDIINKNTVLGIQGNTGTVLGVNGEKLTDEQIKAGRGTHVDITMQDANGNYLSPEQVGEKLGIKQTQKKGKLTPEMQTAANTLAQQIYGSSAIRTKDGYNNFVQPIIDRMLAGESIDRIADDLRFQGQSTAFTGTIREAAQQITSDYTDKKTQTIFDKLDDVLDTGDTNKVQDFLKKIALETVGVEEQKQIRGKERTVEFINEIQNDLNQFEALGGDTNIFTGNIEKLAGKVGTVKDPQLRTIATKIATAVQQYRRSMSGVAFSVPESNEYKSIFPNIDKTAVFNSATIKALTDTFKGDLDYFYGFTMGQDAYNEIFKGGTAQNQTNQNNDPLGIR